MAQYSNEWTEVISSRSKWFDFKLPEVWKYRDLLFLFVKRDFIATYKQTILGPLWFVIQPVITIITYSIVFGYILNISVGNLPRIVFYLGGLIMWNYFADCMNKNGQVFIANANILGKVYFPRMVLPLSIVLSGLVKLGIQFGLFLIVLAWYYIQGEDIQPNAMIWLTPFLVLLVAGLGLGLGMIISALTTRYRDLLYLVQFSVQLLMYATPVIYPLYQVPPLFKKILLLNPMTPVVETFRYAFLGQGGVELIYLGYSAAFMLIVLFTGVSVFNKAEKSFMDTV